LWINYYAKVRGEALAGSGKPLFQSYRVIPAEAEIF